MKARFVLEVDFDLGIWGELREGAQVVEACVRSDMFVTDVTLVSADEIPDTSTPVRTSDVAGQSTYCRAAADVIRGSDDESTILHTH